jgi:hypothetical protein
MSWYTIKNMHHGFFKPDLPHSSHFYGEVRVNLWLFWLWVLPGWAEMIPRWAGVDATAASVPPLRADISASSGSKGCLLINGLTYVKFVDALADAQQTPLITLYCP